MAKPLGAIQSAGAGSADNWSWHKLERAPEESGRPVCRTRGCYVKQRDRRSGGGTAKQAALRRGGRRNALSVRENGETAVPVSLSLFHGLPSWLDWEPTVAPFCRTHVREELVGVERIASKKCTSCFARDETRDSIWRDSAPSCRVPIVCRRVVRDIVHP